VKPVNISEIADMVGLQEQEVEYYGRIKAKVSLDVTKRLADKEDGNYVIVTAINPTKFGEGKSTVTLGLSQV